MRKSIAGFDIFKFFISVFAQQIIVAIVDSDLRDQRKHAFAHRFQTRHKTGDWRKDSRANKTHDPARPRSKLKHSIGGVEQSLRIRERSEEHTSELQSRFGIAYALF